MRLQGEIDLHPQLEPRGLHVTWGAGAAPGSASAAADTEIEETQAMANVTASFVNFILERVDEEYRGF